jgi:hypothetical protein
MQYCTILENEYRLKPPWLLMITIISCSLQYNCSFMTGVSSPLVLQQVGHQLDTLTDVYSYYSNFSLAPQSSESVFHQYERRVDCVHEECIALHHLLLRIPLAGCNNLQRDVKGLFDRSACG